MGPPPPKPLNIQGLFLYLLFGCVLFQQEALPIIYNAKARINVFYKQLLVFNIPLLSRAKSTQKTMNYHVKAQVASTLVRVAPTLVRVVPTLVRVAPTLVRVAPTLVRVAPTLVRVAPTLVRLLQLLSGLLQL